MHYEENANSLANVLTNLKTNFHLILKNDMAQFGGGHLFTRADYQVELLWILHDFRLKYPNQTIYFEPVKQYH